MSRERAHEIARDELNPAIEELAGAVELLQRAETEQQQRDAETYLQMVIDSIDGAVEVLKQIPLS